MSKSNTMQIGNNHGLFCFAILVAVSVAVGTIASYGPLAVKPPANAAQPAIGIGGTSVNSERKATFAVAKRIDALVQEKLDEVGQPRNAPIDDETFLRRVYLDIAGRIPTLDEARDFLSSPSRSKRYDLIDSLLDSYGFVSHQYNYWADVLRIRTRQNRVVGQPYIEFVKDSLQQNQPYDEFVRDLLTAEGSMLEEGATGYYLRDLNMPEDNMSNTVRIFLGTRLECAQCHDHPYDNWTQREYFEMVAFTGGIQYQDNLANKIFSREDRRRFRSIRKNDPQTAAQLRRVFNLVNFGVYGSGTGLAKLPENYLGSDGEENEIVVAKTMFEHEMLVEPEIPSSKQTVGKNNRRRKKKNRNAKRQIPGAKHIESRTAYANWLTSPENERFSINIANRLWKQAFGIGLIEPVDVIDDSTTASNEPLLQYLAETMVAMDFDRKEFLRSIYYSRSYQSAACRTDVNDPENYTFAGPVLRRLSAEQIWDSLLVLQTPEPDHRFTEPVRRLPRAAIKINEQVKSGEIDSLDDLIQAVNGGKNGGDKNRSRQQKGKRREQQNSPAKSNRNSIVDDGEGSDTKPQAGPSQTDRQNGRQPDADANPTGNKKKNKNKNKKTDRKRKGPNEAQQKLRQQVRKQIKIYDQKIRKARQSKDAELEKQLRAQRAKAIAAVRSRSPQSRYKRASEIMSPAPVGHFLREFGQSDRNQIENASHEPAVPQVLSMMNGLIDRSVARDPNTVLMSNVLTAERGEVVDVVFLSMLSRRPTLAERRLWRQDFVSNPREAYVDLIWTIANSNEFIFQK